MFAALALIAALAAADSSGGSAPPSGATGAAAAVSPASGPQAAAGSAPTAAAPAPAPAVTTAAVAPAPPKVLGYIQARSVWQDAPGLTNTINRARLIIDGAFPQRMSYRLSGEFAAAPTGGMSGVALRDAYIRWSRAPVAVTAGQFKTPFSRQYMTSITVIETADRASVVDTLAPKRDIGVMTDLALPARIGLAAGVFNGEGQNIEVNRDSLVLLVARAVAHPFGGVDLGADGAWNGPRTQRYGFEASVERRGWLVRGEWIGQRRPGSARDDFGWFVVAAYRVNPWLQVVAEQEDFERPSLGAKRRMGGTTAGVNLDLPGGHNRFILEYVAHRTGSPFTTHDQALVQWQVRL